MKYSVFVALALALATNARPFGGHHHGGFGGGNNGGNNGGNGAAAASSSAAVVLTSAAAASTTTAAAVDSASTSATATSSVAIPSFSDTATANNPDVQNSLTLDPSVIATGFLNNGQSVQEAGQVASLTSGNNFINFCATRPDLQITNGLQITDGSCNPAPMGLIPSTANMPSAKFTFPTNGGNVAANTPFTISLAIQGMQTGFFVNAEQNYFAAPQQLNAGGQVIGHSHVVVETLSSLTQDTPTDPTKFAFFKGLNAAAVNGILTANVTAGPQLAHTRSRRSTLLLTINLSSCRLLNTVPSMMSSTSPCLVVMPLLRTLPITLPPQAHLLLLPLLLPPLLPPQAHLLLLLPPLLPPLSLLLLPPFPLLLPPLSLPLLPPPLPLPPQLLPVDRVDRVDLDLVEGTITIK